MTRYTGHNEHDSRHCDAQLDDPYAHDQALREVAHRAITGKLLVFPVAHSGGYHEFTAGETPTEGPDAVARWVALLDRAQDLHIDADPTHPCAQRQVRRAIDSLFLYEHQLTPDTRREAREFLWRRDRTEPLPAPASRLEWADCRCRNCRVERALGRPSVAVSGVILPAALASSEASTIHSPAAQRHLWLVSEQAS